MSPPCLSMSHEMAHYTFKYQTRLSFYNMVVGFMSNEWKALMKQCEVEHPQGKMAQILTILWDHICEPIWATRNEIWHSKSNHVSQDELQQLSDKLL